MPASSIEISTLNRKGVQEMYQIFERVVKTFWKRWRKEYLMSLRERHKISLKSGEYLKVGDKVMVHYDNKKGNFGT